MAVRPRTACSYDKNENIDAILVSLHRTFCGSGVSSPLRFFLSAAVHTADPLGPRLGAGHDCSRRGTDGAHSDFGFSARTRPGTGCIAPWAAFARHSAAADRRDRCRRPESAVAG